VIAVGTANTSKAPTMTARPSVGTLNSGTRGLDRSRVVRSGRRKAMLVILALIILVIFDLYLLNEINILEENLRFVIKARQATQDELMKHITEVHHDN
jgi:hypothetical protein